MAKSTARKAKKVKGTVSAKKKKKAVKRRERIAGYMDCLAELHELQVELMSRLRKEIK